MDPTRTKVLPSWAWPVLLVTALHFLTTSGGWWITDHGEILAVADHFLSTGRMDLEGLGPQWGNWTRIVEARHDPETRFQPVSILVLTPFLALDRIFGWRDPASFTFVHLQGHVFVGLGLIFAGRGIARLTGSGSASALAVLLLGLNWPVWMIARRLGPEPVLFALLAAFAMGGTWRRFFCLALLPWTHASGPFLGLGALLSLAVQERSFTSREVRSAALGWILGLASTALLWNLPVHGHLIMGGYVQYATDRFFTLRNPVVGAFAVLVPIVLWTLPLWWLAMRAGKRAAMESLALWFPLAAFLAMFSNPEPERRMAPLLAAWAVVIASGAVSIRGDRAFALVTLSLGSGAIGLASDFVDTVTTPFGVFSGPRLMVLHLAFLKHQPGTALAMVLLLSSAVVLAASRSVDQLREPRRAVLDESGSVNQNPSS